MGLYIDARNTLVEPPAYDWIDLFGATEDSPHHLAMCEDDGEWRAKFMCCNRQKFIFQCIRPTHRFLIHVGNFNLLLPASLLDSQASKLGNAFCDGHIPDIKC